MIIPEDFHYKANGKLLLSGEYFVLDGAKALAIPTQKGQLFKVQPFLAEPDTLFWESYDHLGKTWFEGWFSLTDLRWIEGSDQKIGLQLERLLQTAKSIKKTFSFSSSLAIKTTLEFPRDWGLGSSSTLISFLAKWFDINPFELLKKGFGGSGYDVACASNNTAILYQLHKEKPAISPVDFSPTFHQNLYFVHQGKKQSSRKAITDYRKIDGQKSKFIDQISDLTDDFLNAPNLAAFQKGMLKHEALISEYLGLPKIQDSFLDFPGQLKSLGAWGGDFFLAASDQTSYLIKSYFHKKGYNTIIPYKAMVK